MIFLLSLRTPQSPEPVEGRLYAVNILSSFLGKSITLNKKGIVLHAMQFALFLESLMLRFWI
jgi:hypothetical protein